MTGAAERDQGPPGARAMAGLRWALVAVMALAAVLSVLYATGALARLGGKGGAGAPAAIYYCPMHPSVVQDHPGECPICSMTLVQRLDGAGSTRAAAAPDGAAPAVPGLSEIALAPERIQLLGMKTARASRQPLRSEVRTAGVVTESERGLSQINTRFAGWIQRLAVAETGRQVRKGELLATIYSPDVLRAEQELLTARRWSAEAPAARAGGSPADEHGVPALNLADDARRRLELLGLAEQDIAELVRSGQPSREIAVRAPAAGTVIRRDAVEGSYVQPGASLYTIADLANVWVIADVPELDIGRVRAGQGARLELAAYPGETFTGKVTFLSPTLDAQTRTVRARVELRNPKQRLRPGMYGTVTIALPPTVGLVVPAEAVVDTGELQVVFVALDGGRFQPRRVKVGARAGGQAEILDGVREGEAVVTTASFLIDSESRLRAAIEGAPAGGGTP